MTDLNEVQKEPENKDVAQVTLKKVARNQKPEAPQTERARARRQVTMWDGAVVARSRCDRRWQVPGRESPPQQPGERAEHDGDSQGLAPPETIRNRRKEDGCHCRSNSNAGQDQA